MKFKLALLCLALTLLLCACGQTQETDGPHVVMLGATDYVVDDALGTISDGKYVYAYTLEAVEGGYSLRITYPDGNAWWWTQAGSSSYGGFSDGYDDRNPDFPDGLTLRKVLETELPEVDITGTVNPLIPIFLLLVGVVNVICPQVMWKLRYGWSDKNAEPSERSILTFRGVGIVCLLFGVIMLVGIYF